MLGELLSLFGSSEIWGMLWKAASSSAPIWMPILFIVVWFDLWIDYKRREFIKSQGSVLLEIKLPREMTKPPMAMEMFLNNLYNIFAGNLIKVYMEGSVRPWFSLELVSIDGTVHFYIWMHAKFKGLVESQLYAQFPNIEVHEVPDYTLGVHHDPNKWNFGWFGQLTLTKADAYPIKTYIDYGLHENPKEEFKVDPMVAVLEFLGSLRKGEQAWIQILIQGHTKEGLGLGRIFTKPDWKGGIEKEIKEIVKKATLKPEDKGPEKKPATFLNLSKGQQEVVEAMERNASKYAFDTMIRATYFAEKEAFNANNIGGLLGSFRQFSSPALNGFKPGFSSAFNYPWQDFRGKKKLMNEKQLLEAYKRRSFFNTPFKNFHGKPFILTTEELATIFHLPSEVAATPTLSRIPSKKAEAPANLPI